MMTDYFQSWLTGYLYLPVTLKRSFSFAFGLAAILGNRWDNTLCILFSHLNKVIQVHKLIGCEDTKRAVIEKIYCILCLFVTLFEYLQSLLIMLSNTFWVWPEVGTGILFAVPPVEEEWSQHQ